MRGFARMDQHEASKVPSAAPPYTEEPHKRRKISAEVGAVCDICYNDFNTSSIVLCFHNCTIKTCTDCVMKQLKIEKSRRIHNFVNKEMYSIYYTCSMCQQKSYYRKIRDTALTEGGAFMAKQYRFTNWVQNNPSILINLLEKFINPSAPELRLPEPPATLSDDEDFAQYDLFISTAFYTTPSPSLLPFPYRLLTPPSITAQTVPAQSVPRSIMERFRGSGSPTESSNESSDEAQ